MAAAQDTRELVELAVQEEEARARPIPVVLWLEPQTPGVAEAVPVAIRPVLFLVPLVALASSLFPILLPIPPPAHSLPR